MLQLSLFVFFLCAISAYGDVLVAKSVDLINGEEVVWKISEEKFKSLGPVDWLKEQEFSISDAVLKAKDTLSKKYPGKILVVIRASFFKPIGKSDRDDVFFYKVDVEIFDGENFLTTEEVVMLMNGDLLEENRSPLKN
ncbi:MAG: hypothetical protein V4727_07175 [Verrucomicrobiota bacterium]